MSNATMRLNRGRPAGGGHACMTPRGIVVMLRGLKMFGMAQAVGELMEQGSPAFKPRCPSCRSC